MRTTPASTRFMAAPPAYFAGLALKSRVIVLDPAQLDRLSEARGTSFAMGIETFEVSHDGTRRSWCGRPDWAGGTYLLKRRGDGWEIDELAGWITLEHDACDCEDSRTIPGNARMNESKVIRRGPDEPPSRRDG
jgi:hypothetical protein